MVARSLSACFALLAIAVSAFAQNAVIYVEKPSPGNLSANASLSANKSSSSDSSGTKGFEDLLKELHSTKADAVLLYTDFTSRAGTDLKTFLTNITGLADGVIKRLDVENDNFSNACWMNFEYRIKKVEHDARKAAVYSGDNHHKFLLGHMVVFRMHLNKSEDYLKRCEKVAKECGFACKNTPRVRRWRRLAHEEINRVRDDMSFTLRTYRDIVSHARRKLNHIKKRAVTKSRDIVTQYKNCIFKG